MSRFLAVVAVAISVSSCAFYDYPKRTLVAREGEEVLGFDLHSVGRDSVQLKGASNKPIPLRIGQDLSAGNNNHLTLKATDPSLRQATFEHRWLEYHGGLVLPPF
jgi:hypothetical protein